VLGLSQDHCHTGTLASGIKTPKKRRIIHTGILSVKKHLAHAARIHLYSFNKFLILDYNKKDMEDTMAGYGPAYFVADAHLENFKHHVVHLRWTLRTDHECENQCPDRALFLAAELHAFALYAHSWNFILPPTSVCVFLGPNEDLRYSLPTAAKPNHTFSVSVLTPELARSDLTTTEILISESDLLNSCFELCGNSVQLELHGVRSTNFRDDLLRGSNQKIGFADAMGWNLLKLIRSLEDNIAIAYLKDGRSSSQQKLEAAYDSYARLCLWTTEVFGSQSDDELLSLTKANTGNESSWEHSLLVALADILVTTACLSLQCEVSTESLVEISHIVMNVIGAVATDLPVDLGTKVVRVVAIGDDVSGYESLKARAETWSLHASSLSPDDVFLQEDLASVRSGKFEMKQEYWDAYSPRFPLSHIPTALRKRPLRCKTVKDSLMYPSRYVGWSEPLQQLDAETIRGLHQEADESVARAEAAFRAEIAMVSRMLNGGL